MPEELEPSLDRLEMLDMARYQHLFAVVLLSQVQDELGIKIKNAVPFAKKLVDGIVTGYFLRSYDIRPNSEEILIYLKLLIHMDLEDAEWAADDWKYRFCVGYQGGYDMRLEQFLENLVKRLCDFTLYIVGDQIQMFTNNSTTEGIDSLKGDICSFSRPLLDTIMEFVKKKTS